MKKDGILRKIFGWQPDRRLVAVGALACMVLLLLPLYRIAVYCAPWYDDYGYAGFGRIYFGDGKNLVNALRGAYYCARTEWYVFQGTFSSDMLMALNPMIWGDQYYYLGAILVMTLLLMGTISLSLVLLREVLKADIWSSLTVAAIMVAMVFVLIYTPNGGFYWYTGAIHYVGMHSLLMLLLVGWVMLLCKERKKISAGLWIVWTMVGAVLVGGSNFVTTLQGLVLCFSLIVLGFLMRSRRTLLLLPSALVYVISFGLNVGAPGNAGRGAALEGHVQTQNVLMAVWNSFKCGFQYAVEFSGWITLAVMLLLVPIIWQMVQKLEFRFRYPGLVLVWSFCLYATGFTPSLYALGHAGLGRTLNAVKFTFQILLILNEIYWLGWLSRKRRKSEKAQSGGAVWWFYPLIAGTMLLIFMLEPHQSAKYSTFAAYYYVHSGEAFNFHREYLERIEKIKAGGPDVVVEPYVYKPWVLQSTQLSEDPNYEANRMMANWYGKNSISCIQKNAEQ